MRTDKFESVFLAAWEVVTKNGLVEMSESEKALLETVINDAETDDLGVLKSALEDGDYLGKIDAAQEDVEGLHSLINRAMA